MLRISSTTLVFTLKKKLSLEKLPMLALIASDAQHFAYPVLVNSPSESHTVEVELHAIESEMKNKSSDDLS